MSDKIIGNADILNTLKVTAESARLRKKSMPHVMLAGTAGCGKTSTAKYIAEKLLQTKLLSLTPDNLKESTDISQFCKMLIMSARKYKRYPVVLLDEIHHLSLRVQEVLGLLIESFKAPIQFGGMGQEVEISVPPFTVIGATTDDGKLCKPLRDRFKLRFVYQVYSIEDATKIVRYHANKLEVEPTEEQFEQIAIRSRCVPRVIISHLERYRDFAIVQGKKQLNIENFEGLYTNVLKTNRDGLSETDIRVLQLLYKQGKPLGLETLALSVDENPNTLKNVTEPYLLQKGLLMRGSRGRNLTDEGVKYLLDNDLIEDSNFLDLGDLSYDGNLQ